MPKRSSSMLLALLALAGCPRLVSLDEGEGADEADESGGMDSDTDPATSAEIDGDEGPLADLPPGDTSNECEELSGLYLFALETSLGPDVPLEFLLTIDMFGCTAILEFQPLSLDMGSQTEPREPVGEPLVFTDVSFDAVGHFTLDMGEVMVTGAANPITGSDIEAELALDGHVVHVDAICGTASGTLTSPLQADLAGSSFAALRVTDPELLPFPFPYACDQVPPP
ncbi:hypothetical protein ACNOYE_10745 [Nannocystaceae bacterium ST9]